MDADPRPPHPDKTATGGAASDPRPSGDTHRASELLSQQSTDFGLGRSQDEASAGRDPLLGHDLGDVVIEELIDQGGMGRVYLARQRSPSRPVAVKAMRPGRRSPAAGQRFRREADLLGRLTHPGIARIYTAGCSRVAGEDVPYFAMEYVPGARPLVQACRERGLDTRGRLDLLLAVCQAVAHGHAAGVVHRDLKPGNILVGSDGRPKVIDFGIARLLEDDAEGFTETGEFVGTRQYTSPEQCDGGPIGPATDVYSLGVIIYELLGGRLPYDVSGTSLTETARIVRERQPARLNVPDRTVGGAAAIAAKCLAKRVADRYPSAAELAADLERLLEGQPPLARSPGPWQLLRAWARRHQTLTAAGLATVITAATVAMLGSGRWLPGSAAPPSAGPGLAASFPTISSRRTTPLQWLALSFNEPVGSLSLADFRLTRDGKDVPLEGVELAGQRTSWELRGLEPLTAREGHYLLELRGTAKSPVDLAGRRLTAPARATWRMPPYHEFAFGLLDDTWREHVVSMTDVEYHKEQHSGQARCIRPTVAGREGAIVMRFDAPFQIRAATLLAKTAVWTTGDPFPYDPDARAALDVSPDGVTWTTVDVREANRGGEGNDTHDIREIVAGSREVWVRARLTAVRKWPIDGLIYAQFLRTDPQRPDLLPFRLTLAGPDPEAAEPPPDTPPADG
jgi:serine/threonine protein kinase